MTLIVVGLSHKTAPIELRERFAVEESSFGDLLSQLRGLSTVNGVALLSTCNRVEVYGSSQDPTGAIEELKDWFCHRVSLSRKEQKSLYDYSKEEAVRHLFRVSSSLDSMVIGEAQILNQVKQAFKKAANAGTLDPYLNRCFTRALHVAKKVRTETGIAQHAVSVAQVSVELAKKIFGGLTGCHVLVVGAGKTSFLAARSLASQGVSNIDVVNRSIDRAQELATKLGGNPHGMDELSDLLGHVDIVISSTSSTQPVIAASDVRRALARRKYRPLFLIDIAVPRDIEPAVSQLPNVYLFDIDDLQKVVRDNLAQRSHEAREANRIVVEQAQAHLKALRADSVVPTIVQLRQSMNHIKDEELNKALGHLQDLDPRQRERITQMANTLVNRLLHHPTVTLKRLAKEGNPHSAVELLGTLFDLESAENTTTEE